MVDDQAIQTAVDEPPLTTRARLRGRFIGAAQAHRRAHTADWMTLSVRDLNDGTVILPDPLVASDPRVDALIARMASEPRRQESQQFTAPPLRD